MAEREESLKSLIELLGLVPSGKATVSVQGRPLLTIDADKKTIDLEADGVREAGLRISDQVKLEEGGRGRLGGAMRVTGALARLGWKLSLYAEGDRVVSMGSGVSRLTGHISVNPLKLRKLLDAMK